MMMETHVIYANSMNLRLIELEQRTFTSRGNKMINKRFIEKWSSIDLEEYKYEYVKKLVQKDIKTKKIAYVKFIK